MSDIMFRLLLGHLAGDYLLQNDWMALNKKKRWLPCLIHCSLYTFCVGIFLMPLSRGLSWQSWWCCYQLIFLSHIVVDRTGIVEWWLNLIKGRAFKRIGAPTDGVHPFPTDARTVRLIYTCIVQTVADNAIHLVLMYFILQRFCG